MDDRTLTFDFVNDASTMFAMSDEIYRDNPVLMREFVLILRVTANPSTLRRYRVVDARLDPNDADHMLLTIASNGLAFSEFVGQPTSQVPNAADVEMLLLPRFFDVSTNGVGGAVPANSSVTITFEGAVADTDGNPDVSGMLPVPSTGDVTALFDMGLSQPIEFVRFEVEFNLDVADTGLSATAPRPALEFLRLPFRF